MIINVNNENFNQEVMAAKTLVLADFYATWCGPCKMLAPVLEEIEKKYFGKIKVLKIDVDKEEELAVKYGITSIPTVIFFKNGGVVTSFAGYKAASEIEKIIEKHV